MVQLEIPSAVKDGSPFYIQRGRVGCILIHGFTGSPWSLDELGMYLAEMGITVSAPLLPGHGTRPEDMIGVEWKEWVRISREEVLRLQKSCEEIFFLGLSMGGSIALILAMQMVCSGVICLAAPVQIHDPRLRWIFLAKPFIRYWKKKSRSHSVSLTEEIAYDRYPIAAVEELTKLLDFLENRLCQVHCPVLIIHGRGDQRVRESNATAIYQGVGSTDKRIVWLNGSCHVITKGEDKNRVAQEIAGFIHSHAKSTGTA
jgi:carboxylesterase